MENNFNNAGGELESIFKSLDPETNHYLQIMLDDGYIESENLDNVVNMIDDTGALKNLSAINSALQSARLSSGAISAIIAAYKIAHAALKAWFVPFNIRAVIAIAALGVIVGVIAVDWLKIRPYFSRLISAFVGGLSKIGPAVKNLFDSIKAKADAATSYVNYEIAEIAYEFVEIRHLEIVIGNVHGEVALAKNKSLLLTVLPINVVKSRSFYEADRKSNDGNKIKCSETYSKIAA